MIMASGFKNSAGITRALVLSSALAGMLACSGPATQQRSATAQSVAQAAETAAQPDRNARNALPRLEESRSGRLQ